MSSVIIYFLWQFCPLTKAVRYPDFSVMLGFVRTGMNV